MAKKKRGMEAVMSKSSGVGRPRKPIWTRKGAKPAVSITVALGKKLGVDAPDEKDAPDDAEDARERRVAKIKAQIAALEAELATLDADDEADEPDDEHEDDDA